MFARPGTIIKKRKCGPPRLIQRWALDSRDVDKGCSHFRYRMSRAHTNSQCKRSLLFLRHFELSRFTYKE